MNKYLRFCLNCKKGFYLSKRYGIGWSVKTGRGKYCSSKCYHEFSKGKVNNTGKTLFKKGEVSDENHPKWKGDRVGYRGIHSWVQSKNGKATKCSNDIRHKCTCYVWANISGEYKRDLNDWHELCQSCNAKDGVKIPNRLKGGYIYQT